MQTLQRIALGVEYVGSRYHGFQTQQTGIETIQLHLESALGKVANLGVTVICAGRTDTGVHAIEQVVHFETTAVRPEKAWVLGANALLPGDISVKWAKQVTVDFHARFSATARHYSYVIHNKKIRSALLTGCTTPEHRPLNENLMAEAGQYLLGENDFSSFRAAGCQSNTAMRNVSSLEVSREGDLVFIDICANAFLHHMVRNIAGLLLDVGAGAKKPVDVQHVLLARDRSKASITAPPQGLYLSRIEYPADFNLPLIKAQANRTAIWGLVSTAAL